MLARTFEPFDMESFIEYVERLFEMWDRMVKRNQRNDFSIGGIFNGFNVVVDSNSTVDSIKLAWTDYWKK